jgi:mannose-1-phosphate guanylyltransferase
LECGLFLAWPKTLLELFETHAPEILEACRSAVDEAIEDLGFIVLGKSYGNAPSISLDYAVVEKAERMIRPAQTLANTSNFVGNADCDRQRGLRAGGRPVRLGSC